MAGNWQHFFPLCFYVSAGRCRHTYIRRKHREKNSTGLTTPVCSCRTSKAQVPLSDFWKQVFPVRLGQKLGGKRGHWRLVRESEVLLLGDTVMIPDFALIDEADETRKILIELVGFWHPTYLKRKVEKVHAANCAHLLLLVYQGLNVTEEAFEGSASEVIFFQNKPVLKEVMETVEVMANRIYGPRQKRKRKKKTQSPD